MTEREALRLALEALEEINKLSIGKNAVCLPAEIDTAMDAIKQALEQPEPEPVAITITGKLGNTYSFTGDYNLKKGDKVYTTPPKRESLTHEQRLDLLTAFDPHKTAWNAHSILIDMVEAAHGIGEKK